VLAHLRAAVWGLISLRSWRGRWSAWYRKSGKLLPLTCPNSPQPKHTHKIHAQQTTSAALNDLIQTAQRMKPAINLQTQTDPTLRQTVKPPNTRTSAAKVAHKKRSAQMSMPYLKG
jgi:hypothetical protein